MSIPAINWQFARAPGIIDPRATFTRATTAMRMGPNGYLEQVAANVPRFEHDPVTRRCLGYLAEQQRTNRMLRSQEFDNASWTKTNLSVSANSAVAPDGTTTADTLTASAAGAACAQACSFTSGHGAAFSVYARAGTATFLKLWLTNGVNTVAAWFNLAAGSLGTTDAGGGSVLYSQGFCEAIGRGWYRCTIEVTTASVTSLTAGMMPAAADGSDSANTDAVYAWGAQFEADATYTSVSSYIPTTSATVTRNADNLHMPVSSAWFADAEGSLVVSVIHRPVQPVASGDTSPLYGGFGDTGAFADKIYISRSGSTSVYAVVGTSAGGGSATPTKTTTWTPGARRRMAVAWAKDNVGFTADGAAPSLDMSQEVPVAANLARMSVGAAPWGTGLSTANIGRCIFESWQYFPARLSNADMQALTAL